MPEELGRLLELLGSWLGHPAAAHHEEVRRGVCDGAVVHLRGHWPVPTTDSFLAGLDEYEGSTLRQLYCFAAAPKGFTSFLRRIVGTADYTADACAVVAELAAAHDRTWQVYVKEGRS